MEVHQTSPEAGQSEDSFWMRLFYSVVLFVLFAFAETALWVIAVLQIILRLVSGQPNAQIASFSERLGTWTSATVRYLGGASTERPFPWDKF